MLKKIVKKIKDLGIHIEYEHLSGNGYFGFENDTPIIIINTQLNSLETTLTLLHEVAHFLNGDCDKCIANSLQNNHIEYEANKYMIYEVIKMLDEKYEFTPDTNYQQIIDSLNLPYHLDCVVIKAFFELIDGKFGDSPY